MSFILICNQNRILLQPQDVLSVGILLICKTREKCWDLGLMRNKTCEHALIKT